jgi:hypothetical protein
MVSTSRNNTVLVYGKDPQMWVGHEKLLQTIHDLGFQIHGTVAFAPAKLSNASKAKPTLPPFVHNHGLLDGASFHRLLGESLFFLGFGFPYEGKEHQNLSISG